MASNDAAAEAIEDDVAIVATPQGEKAHIRVNGSVLCHAGNSHRGVEETDDIPEGGLCSHCKRVGMMVGVVEVPTDA